MTAAVPVSAAVTGRVTAAVTVIAAAAVSVASTGRVTAAVDVTVAVPVRLASTGLVTAAAAVIVAVAVRVASMVQTVNADRSVNMVAPNTPDGAIRPGPVVLIGAMFAGAAAPAADFTTTENVPPSWPAGETDVHVFAPVAEAEASCWVAAARAMKPPPICVLAGLVTVMPAGTVAENVLPSAMSPMV